MKILKKIRAFFTIQGKQEHMDLVAAEINPKGVFLHPKDDPEHSFFVKSNSIDIFISPGTEMSEDDILIFNNPDADMAKNNAEVVNTGADPSLNSNPYSPRSKETGNISDNCSSYRMSNEQNPNQKKRFSVMLYSDEYEMLMKIITENGYKRHEYFMACIASAKKQSMAATYKRYMVDHKRRKEIDLIEAQKHAETRRSALKT